MVYKSTRRKTLLAKKKTIKLINLLKPLNEDIVSKCFLMTKLAKQIVHVKNKRSNVKWAYRQKALSNDNIATLGESKKEIQKKAVDV
jgi:hypothetical protein